MTRPAAALARRVSVRHTGAVLGSLSEGVKRQVGIVTGLTLAFVACSGGMSVWRARTPGLLPKLPPRPFIANAAPNWAQRPNVAAELPIPPTFGDGWRIVNQYSAHRMLIVEVETGHVEQALTIAIDAVDAVKDKYSEVLVYFHRPRRTRVLASARVQWTPRRGYTVIKYEELDGEGR